MHLSDTEVARFLEQSYNVRLATLSPRGVPLITPIWFNIDGPEILIGTAVSTLSVRNIRTHPHVVACFDAEGRVGNQRVLRLYGSATVSEEMLPLRLLPGLFSKYYLAPTALRSELAHARQQLLRLRYYAQQTGPALIRIRPKIIEFLPSAIHREPGRMTISG